MNRQTAVLTLIVVGVLVGVGAVFLSKIKASAPAAGSSYVIPQAQELLSQGSYAEAKKLYQDALPTLETKPDQFRQAQKQIEDINMQSLLSGAIDENSREYIVKPGDSLTRIAKNFGTTIELIKKINGLDSDILRVGQRLKVVTARFSIFIDKSRNILQLKKGDEVFKTYIVSTGKDNSSPVGTFKIANKLVDPIWFKSGAVIPPGSPDNILGPRWMGFDLKGYGIHGTTEPDKLGQQVSLGCVRMLNDELIELYDIVPTGTEVVIED